jgi:hypothetical protein
MNKLTRETLLNLKDQLGAHPMCETDIDELVDPRLGIITGFQDLLDQLETLRQIDLGDTPPAQGVQRRRRARKILP